MFPNMNIISTTYYRVTTFIHIYPKILVLRLFHENITVITIDGCTCSIVSIYIIIISFMSSTLSYGRLAICILRYALLLDVLIDICFVLLCI